MRKNLLALLVVCAFGVFTAIAQDSSSGASQNSAQQPSYSQPSASGQQSSTTTQSTTTSTQSTTGTMGSSGQSGSSSMPPDRDSATSNGDTGETIEGCVTKDETGYAIQPVNGGTRTQLTPSRSLDPYVGQHVQVKAQNDNGNNTSATASSGGSTGSTSAMSGQGGELTVTGIKVVSTTCSPTSGRMQR